MVMIRSFSALLGMSLAVCFFTWWYLPPHDLHPKGHPLDMMLELPGDESESEEAFLHSNKGKDQPREDASIEPNYHMVFSTSCSPFQDWQSYLFFYFARKVQQTGTVTRIASGCKDKDRKALQEFHDEKIAVMSDQFHIHFAPPCPDSRSKYFNKPYGLRDFMEQVLGYPNNKDHDNDIIMIVDPDMILLRPLTHKFDLHRINWVLPELNKTKHKNKKNEIDATQFSSLHDTVEHGKPISQAYGFGNTWLTSLGSHATSIAGKDSPVLQLSLADARIYYPAGPPYLATARDMYNIAIHWTQFVVRVHNVFPKMMSEMHAYSFSAAHLKLPHQLAKSFMVSDVSIDDMEGWGFLQHVKNSEACIPDAIPQDNLPFVFHYCQRYALGRWFIGKYKIPKHLFDCNSPLLREPPTDVPVKYNWFIYPNNKDTKDYSHKPFRVLQNGWAMCLMIRYLNEAATDYKSKYCPKGRANLTKSFIFHKPDDFEAFLNGEVPNLSAGPEND
jgi:peptidyl serine alpha-galactosyltransferase